MSVDHIWILVGIGIAILFMGAAMWHSEREGKKNMRFLSQQMLAHQQETDRYFREARNDSKIWRQRLSLAIARISEVVDTSPEEKK